MTLQEFLAFISSNPDLVLAYFILIPISSLIIGLLSYGYGHASPWKYIYSLLVYLVCIPGVFVLSMSIYQFLFERASIYGTDMVTQVVPVLSMCISLLIIKRYVALKDIPGFGQVSGLFMMTLILLLFMWGLDNTKIYLVAFTRMPFYFVIGIFVVIFLILKMGFSRLTS